MTDTKPSQKPSSAPPLPVHIAKQYGLHRQPASPSADTVDADSTLLEDAATAAAVDDIVASESDALLAAQDATQASTPAIKPHATGFWRRIGRFFAAWWHNRWARNTTIIFLLLGMAAAISIPQSRYFLLNTGGVRSSASVTVLDRTTQLPLKNVTVSLGALSAKTGKDGIARFRDLKLGSYDLRIKRIAFAGYTRSVTIGWGSNPLGSYQLTATGIQYEVQLSDYLSGKPVNAAEVASEQAIALSDKTGKATLTVDDREATTLEVTVQAPGYRSETLTIDAESTTVPDIRLVPDSPAVYLSRQSGTYDMYRADLDGKNAKVVLRGTGHESSNMGLVVNDAADHAALVSVRGTARDGDGYPLSTLTLVNLRDGTATPLDNAVQIQLVAWQDTRIIYKVAASGASAANAQRYRLIAYNYETNAKTQLATANQFSALLAAGHWIYYAPSSTDPNASLGLFKIRPDGTGRKKVFNQEVWTVLRTGYQSLALQTPAGWIRLATDSETTEAVAPPTFASRHFIDAPQGSLSVWADTAAGEDSLMLYDAQKMTNKTVVSQEGIAYPYRWAGTKAVVYRVVTATETADYVLSPHGGRPHKITDVVSTVGFSQGF